MLTKVKVFLLKHYIPGKRIVLLTFTRRAAAGMTRRLEMEVGDLSRGIFAGAFHRWNCPTCIPIPAIPA